MIAESAHGIESLPAGAATVATRRSLWHDAFRRFRKNWLAVGSLSFVLFALGASIIGPLLSPYNYQAIDLTHVNAPPSAAHWFGTDQLGRDYLTRIMMGGRTAFLVATVVVSVTAILGVAIGAVSAYAGGFVDSLLMRFTDTVMSFPHLLLAMFIVGTVRPPLVTWLNHISFLQGSDIVDYCIVLVALSSVGWPGYARLVRGQILSLTEREFIEAERAIGASPWTIIWHHLVPNSLDPIIVAMSASFGSAMILESSLSFLGIGIRPPGASWGNMINESLDTWRYQPHLLAIPGITLALVVLAFNFIGDALNDALNPQLGRP